MNLGINGRRALVLGASQGLGAASAKALAAEGVETFLLARNEARLMECVAEIATAGGRAHAIVADLGRRASLDGLFDGSALGRAEIDILVLNAPPPPPVTAGDFNRAQWLVQFESLFLNQADLCRHFVAGMAARGWGRIVAIASTSIIEPFAGLVYSNAIRAGLQGYLKSLADEVAGQGVTINSVAPGSFATERLRKLDEAAAAARKCPIEEIAKENAAAIPAGRYGRPEELGALVAYLCGETTAFLTGAIIRMDGGATRSSL